MALDEPSSALALSGATFVLVGGEAYEWHGVEWEEREFQHTSVPFVGTAYEALRSAGVPRSNIITVAQVSDYIANLALGERGALTAASGVPAKWYGQQQAATEEKCRRLLAEGGADYDFEDVNPGTVWSVLLGEPPPLPPAGPLPPEAAAARERCRQRRPVVPADGQGAIVLAVYTHGDRHPAAEGSEAQEWFAHLPYASTRPEIYDFVAVDGARITTGRHERRPQHYLYATQLRLIFHRVFERCPGRPVVGLLNYCLSGGNLEFMRREVVRRHLHVDQWPLFLMSSSQAGRESMVAGLWDAWFHELQTTIQGGAGELEATTVMDLFQRAQARYYQQNMYEFLNAVKARIYVPEVFERHFAFPGQADGSWDPWHIDLSCAMRRSLPSPGGALLTEPFAELQRQYESGEAFSLVTGATPEQRARLRAAGGVAEDPAKPGDVVVWMRAPGCGQGWRPGMAGATEEALQGLTSRPLLVQLVEYSGTRELGRCACFADVVRRVLFEDVAQPEEVHGSASGIAGRSLASLVSPVCADSARSVSR